ncbi:acetolactate synthase 2 catalytic subunit [Pleionea sediminis]|uniref:acetolactate synthase 2 catalytic subunit n=1 Tax=Pleionea sediminis TaxID=2569479 RepID=UPI0011855349|nr:acetolactate synthase 2 catalytic subunit [Pleionea sediminis]
MNGSQYLVNALEANGIKTLFGYPGGAIMPVYDALVDSEIEHILCRHEQGAALAADGYARSSGKLGVCIATSGPGATNLITGLANAYLDSIPVLAITGQVASGLIGTDAFQEVDILGMTFAVVKQSYLVEDVNDLPAIINEAMSIAVEGRPGPVLIDIPKDIQLNRIQTPVVQPSNVSHQQSIHSTASQVSELEVKTVLELLAKAHRPLAYVGGGVGIAEAESELRSFLQSSQIPAVSTLKGLGATGNYHLNLGMLGMHGLKAANFAVQECDLLINFGARFDDRATGKLNQFAPNAQVIHFDTDVAEVNKLKAAYVGVIGHLKSSLERLNQSFHQMQFDNARWIAWSNWCYEQKEAHAWQYEKPGDVIYAPRLINTLSNMSCSNAFISCDVGQHQMWVAQHCQFEQQRFHLSSGGAGTMGYGLPAAIGAQLAHPNAVVINVCGDGSFAMNIQELMTLKRYSLPVKILLLDNSSLGMVRQWQHLFFKDRYSEIDLSDNPDFVRVAEAFGLVAKRINKKADEKEGLRWLLQQDSPALLHVVIDSCENVWPLVPPGASNCDMLEEKLK